MEQPPNYPHRLLFIGHTASLGGAELAMARLIRNLDRTRFTPLVLLFAEGPLVTMLREMDVEVHCIPLASEVNKASRTAANWSGFLQLRALAHVVRQIRRVTTFIRKHHIDLVHTNSLKAAVIGGVAAALARKPLVWYVHDRIAADYLPKFAVRSLHFLALTLPTFVVGNSVSTLRTFLPKLPLRCGVVYPGVDTDLFHSSGNIKSEAPSTSPVKIGLVGRISPTKGQDIFIRAASLVARQHPKAQFLIVGSAMFNDAPWEVEVRRLANEQNEADIRFTGFCANIPETMAALDVVVHASTVPEPFGQVVAEAMCCGKPVIAIKAGGVQEVVSDGVCGWLVRQGDVEEMAERIVWLINNPEEAAAMGQRGRQKVAAHFTVKKMARDMEAIYEQALAAKVPRTWRRLWQPHSVCALGVEQVASIFTN